MPRAMLKRRQDCKSHEYLLNFRTTYPIKMNVVAKLINPAKKTCETNSQYSIKFNASKYGMIAFTHVRIRSCYIFYTITQEDNFKKVF